MTDHLTDPGQDPRDFCAAVTTEARATLARRQLGFLAAREAVVRAFVCNDPDGARKHSATAAQARLPVP